MKKILISLAIIGAVGAIAAGATGAFFSDTETSTGNTFTAGAIDLTIDNTCYYNAQACTDGFWGGVAANGVCSCNFDLRDLTDELFFDLADLKPGDWEEDTISIHVDNNESWVCADVTLTSNKDVTCTDPEIPDDLAANGVACGAGDSNSNGDLAQELTFIWWADDGDNVLEDDERLITPDGKLGDLGVGNTATVALADSNRNIWNVAGGPLAGSSTRLIGKAFCFGDFRIDPVPAGRGVDPTVDPGFFCDGVSVDNASQTDNVTMDVAFRAVQSRNNSSFVCARQAG